MRAPRVDEARSPPEQHTPSSVTSASNVTLRSMHERVAVISIDASTNNVRQRSASINVQSVTKVGMIER